MQAVPFLAPSGQDTKPEVVFIDVFDQLQVPPPRKPRHVPLAVARPWPADEDARGPEPCFHQLLQLSVVTLSAKKPSTTASNSRVAS